jgi:hypothetical protein
MKIKIKKKITLEFVLDSSETIMFTKGGMHKEFIPAKDFHNLLSDFIKKPEVSDDDYLYGDDSPFDSIGCELEITFQMQKDQQSRFDFINGEAQKAHQRRQDESKNP